MPLTIKRTNITSIAANSVLFDGTSQYLSIPGNAAFAFGTGNFTIEWWQYMTSQPSNPRVFSIGNYASATIGVSIEGGTFYVWENSGVRFNYSLTADGYLNRWLHFAISRNNGTTSIFKNGIQIGSSYSDTNNINNTSTALSIGQESTPTANSYFPGYISNFRIVNGTAVYTSNFTPPTSPLTAIANTSLLTCNAPTIVDSSTNNFTITNNGSATVSSLSPTFPAPSNNFQFAKRTPTVIAKSILFNSSPSQYLSIPNNAAFTQNQPFTYECWFYPTAANNSYVFAMLQSNFLTVKYQSDSTFTVDMSYVGFPPGWVSNAITRPINNWYHVALSWNDTNGWLFINGRIEATFTGAGATVSSGNPLLIGQYQGQGQATPLGYISNFRVVKGTAIYTGSFTPPTAPLTAISGTQLLTCNADTIVDSSTNNFTITNNGSVTVSSVSPFVASSGGMSLKKVYADPATLVTNGLVLYLDASNASSYPGSGTTWTDLSGNNNNGTLFNGVGYNSANGGSLVFDGVDDYATVSNNITSGTGDFAVSVWVYKTETASNRYIWDFGSNGGTLSSGTNVTSGFRYYNPTIGIGGSLYNSGPVHNINTWYNIVISRISGTTYFYSNGSLITSGADAGNIGSWGTTLNIGRYAGGSGLEHQGRISSLLVYKNKGLTLQEIQQNYNATRARFGL